MEINFRCNSCQKRNVDGEYERKVNGPASYLATCRFCGQPNSVLVKVPVKLTRIQENKFVDEFVSPAPGRRGVFRCEACGKDNQKKSASVITVDGKPMVVCEFCGASTHRR